MVSQSVRPASWRVVFRGERVEGDWSEAHGSSRCCRVSGPMLGVVKAGKLKLREGVRVFAFAR